MNKILNVASFGRNSSNGGWWLGTMDEESSSPLALDSSENGLWSGNFVPPPPRPLFLDEGISSDGLTTCDLCTWAWQNTNTFTLDAAMEAPGEIGWVLTLVIVSLISAVVGAIIMIIVLHCRRLKGSAFNDIEQNCGTMMQSTRGNIINRPPISVPCDKNTSQSTFPSSNSSNNGVWAWLTRKPTLAPSQLDAPPTSPTENHYTHMDETYSAVGEALYAELDRDSNSPAYQNSAYTDPEAPPSSAPSSAYYSDLSVTTMPDRAYEVVGLVTMPIWDGNQCDGVDTVRRPLSKLAAINETVTIPSDYV